jgi:hypothetical protein
MHFFEGTAKIDVGSARPSRLHVTDAQQCAITPAPASGLLDQQCGIAAAAKPTMVQAPDRFGLRQENT